MTISYTEEVKDFYKAVIGWEAEPVSMGDYNDYTMKVDDDGKAGVCHKKGLNASTLSQWMIYINVAKLDDSLSAVNEKGDKALSEIKDYGAYGRACIIEDPGGAVCTLFEPK